MAKVKAVKPKLLKIKQIKVPKLKLPKVKPYKGVKLSDYSVSKRRGF